jgi:chemotaxis signal transduction protein
VTRARLQKIGRSLDEQRSLSEERALEVMAERARVLGLAPASVAAGPQVDLVRFVCGGERFALETQFIRATVKLPKLSPVPFGPPALLGLCAFRGQLLSVWDPADLLTGQPAKVAPEWLLVLGASRVELGLAVQDVSFVQQTPREEVAPVPDALQVAARAHLFRGLIAGESILVLSGEAVLAEPRLTWS